MAIADTRYSIPDVSIDVIVLLHCRLLSRRNVFKTGLDLMVNL